MIFNKTIEVYDGEGTYHYISPFGSILLTIGLILGFIGQFVFMVLQINDWYLQPIWYGIALCIIGSFIGKDM